MKLKLFKKWDFIIIAVVLLAAAAFMLWQRSGTEPLTAEISVDGEVVETVDLSKVTTAVTFVPDTSPKVVIVAENGKIRFESSGCRDQICVKCGELYRKGDTAVCLPAKTVITVKGSDLDALTY